GNDGGIWYSTSANTCNPYWTNLNTGLGLTQFYAIAAHPTDSNTYIGGTQDNGTPERTGDSNTWEARLGSDGGWAAFDYKSPSTMYASNQWPTGLLRSDDSGSTFHIIMAGINTNDPSEVFIPVAIDPTTPTTLYLGTNRLYKTTNSGNLWYIPTPGLPPSNVISAIAVAPSNGSYFYVGTSSGQLFVSADGGNTFTEYDSPLFSRRP